MADAKELVQRLHAAVLDAYPDSARRQQFENHLATVAMTLDHLEAETSRDSAREE